MKLKYTKPAIALECFDLNQSIAAGCGAASSSTVGDPNQWDKHSCGWQIDSNIVIWVEGPVCNEWAGEDEEVDGICYNNPSGGQSIFCS